MEKEVSGDKTAEEIVNLIMNGGKTAEGKGRKNLQEWGVEMIKDYHKQRLNSLKEKIENLKNFNEGMEVAFPNSHSFKGAAMAFEGVMVRIENELEE